MSFKTFFPTNVCRTEKQYAAAEKVFNENNGTGMGINGNPFVPCGLSIDKYICKFAFCFRSGDDLVHCYITPGGRVRGLTVQYNFYPL